MKVKARFHVNISGWVTITRKVEAFDKSRADDLGSNESDILDSMADEAIMDADMHLDGEIDESEVLEVSP